MVLVITGTDRSVISYKYNLFGSSTVGRRGTGSGRCCRCRLVGQPAKLVAPRSLKTSSPSLAATSLSESDLGFFGVGGLPQSPVFFTKKRRIISITNKQPKYWYRAATEGGDTYIEQYCSNSPVGGDANITTA